MMQKQPVSHLKVFVTFDLRHIQNLMTAFSSTSIAWVGIWFPLGPPNVTNVLTASSVKYFMRYKVAAQPKTTGRNPAALNYTKDSISAQGVSLILEKPCCWSMLYSQRGQACPALQQWYQQPVCWETTGGSKESLNDLAAGITDKKSQMSKCQTRYTSNPNLGWNNTRRWHILLLTHFITLVVLRENQRQ